MTAQMPCRCIRSAGFTLVELSIVLVIISLLTAGGLVVGTAMVGRAAYVDTTKQMQQINQSLQDYYVTNGRLPCVASLSSLPGTADFGVEVGATGTTCAGGVAENPPAHRRVNNGSGKMVRIGMLPVRTLGLPDSAAADKYGNRIIYAVTEELTDKGLFGASAGAITIKDLNNNNILTDAAYFIASPGRDRKGALAYSNGNQVEACGASSNLDVLNCTLTTTIFRDAPYNTGSQAAFFFDDIVRWVPKFHLMAQDTQSTSLWAGEDSKVWSIGMNNDLATYVGIGTDTPEDRLHVDGAVRIEADNSFLLRLINNAAPADYQKWAILDNFDQGKLVFRSRNPDWSSKKTFLSMDHVTGFLGVGVTAPEEELHLDGTFRIDSNGAFFMYLNNSAAPANFQKWSLLDQNNLGKLTFKSRDSSWVEKDTFISMDHTTGNVGIGTTDPLQKLHVVGNTRISGNVGINTATAATNLHVTGNARIDTNNDFYMYFSNPSAPAGLRNWTIQDVSSAGKLVFRSRNDDWSFKRTYFTMDESTGNIGLFTSTPTEKVHVNGNMKIGERLTIDPDLAYNGSPGTSIYGTTATNEHLTLYAQNNSSNGASISLAGRTASFWGDGRITYRASYDTSNIRPMHHFYRITSGGGVNPLMEVRANADVFIYGSNYYAASDQRLKKDVRPIENALDKVMAINGIYYRWNEKSGREDTDSVHLGVLAQEVQAVLPEAVQKNEDGFLALDRSSLVPVLIEAVKELRKENEALRAEIKNQRPDSTVMAVYDPFADYRLWVVAALIALSTSVITTLLLRKAR